MKTELERCKEALKVAQAGLRMFASSSSVSGMLLTEITTAADDTLQEVDVLLNPPPEMEEVEVTAGWVNVYQPEGEDPYCGVFTHTTKRDADCADSDTPRIDCREIRVKVKRPKPQPVERSVELRVSWIKPPHHRALPIAAREDNGFEWEQLIGKHGTLTFTWHEQP